MFWSGGGMGHGLSSEAERLLIAAFEIGYMMALCDADDGV
jgi:hypothetical protein